MKNIYWLLVSLLNFSDFRLSTSLVEPSNSNFRISNHHSLIYTIIAFIFISLPVWAIDGQIDIDELIKRRETEQQTLEKISSTLHEITGNTGVNKEYIQDKLKGFLRNEDDEIVRFDDNSDEINFDYFVNLFTDNSFRRAIVGFVNKAAFYINNKINKDNNNNNIIEYPYYIISTVICFVISLIITSISTISGKEASAFPMVIKDVSLDSKYIDKKVEQLEEKNIISFEPKESSNENSYRSPLKNILESSYEYKYDVWLQLGQQAISNLSNYSDDIEFKKVYSHFQKRFVLSGRAIEDAILEIDSAGKTNDVKNTTDDNLLILLIKIKILNKYAGSEINGINNIVNETDLAYISTLSNTSTIDNADTDSFWSISNWN